MSCARAKAFRRALGWLIAFGLVLARPGVADAQRRAPYELVYDLRVDLPLTIAGGSFWLGSELLKDRLAPAPARWTQVNQLDALLAGAARWQHTERAAAASDWIGLRMLPLLAVSGLVAGAAVEGRAENGWLDSLIVLEAAFSAAAVNQIVKLSAGRRRPYAERTGDHDVYGSDTNLSFYSGHTSFAFSFAVAAATTAQLRGYRAAPYLWAIGLPLAAFTGYARMAADRHYFTDVLTGALVGSAVAAAVPLLMHARRQLPAGLSASIAPPFLLVQYTR